MQKTAFVIEHDFVMASALSGVPLPTPATTCMPMAYYLISPTNPSHPIPSHPILPQPTQSNLTLHPPPAPQPHPTSPQPHPTSPQPHPTSPPTPPHPTPSYFRPSHRLPRDAGCRVHRRRAPRSASIYNPPPVSGYVLRSDSADNPSPPTSPPQVLWTASTLSSNNST